MVSVISCGTWKGVQRGVTQALLRTYMAGAFVSMFEELKIDLYH